MRLTGFVIMGVLEQVATGLDVSIGRAGLLIPGYALGAGLGGVVIEQGGGFSAVPVRSIPCEQE